MKSLKFASAALLITAFSGACTQKPTLKPLEQAQFAQEPEKITIELRDYRETTGRRFKHLFVSNFSVKASRGQLDYSSSRDGMTDTLKRQLEPVYGFVAGNPDWNGDSYGDLLMYLSGITAIHQNSLYCGPNQRTSASNDAIIYPDRRYAGSPMVTLGLRDCEKVFLQLNPVTFDYDRDGIPDYLEIRAGLNPKNPADADLGIAGDSLTNIEKVKANIPTDENAVSQANSVFAYKYSTNFNISGDRDFTISNIPILNGGRDNMIVIFLTETDVAGAEDFLFSAYTVLRQGAGGQTFRITFWGGNPSATDTNTEICLYGSC